jgi:hypothetical protein
MHHWLSFFHVHFANQHTVMFVASAPPPPNQKSWTCLAYMEHKYITNKITKICWLLLGHFLGSRQQKMATNDKHLLSSSGPIVNSRNILNSGHNRKTTWTYKRLAPLNGRRHNPIFKGADCICVIPFTLLNMHVPIDLQIHSHGMMINTSLWWNDDKYFTLTEWWYILHSHIISSRNSSVDKLVYVFEDQVSIPVGCRTFSPFHNF